MDQNRKQSLTHLRTVESGSLHSRKTIAGRYELIARIGRGGMGEVWRARDLKLGTEIALKALRLDLRTENETMQMFRREVSILRGTGSPNVCRIYDLVVDEDLELIAMEYIDGQTLLSLLEQNKPLILRDSRNIASQFLAGLEAIHGQGIAHRDLKPENIMITSSGRVVVMDFGLVAKALHPGGVITGTPAYMSPEQQSGEIPDARSDLFSAGFIIAELAYCESLKDQSTREELWNVLRRVPRLLPDHPWKEMIVRAVARDPSHRFSSARELRLALEQAVGAQNPFPSIAGDFTLAIERNETRMRRGRKLAASLAICLLLVLAFAFTTLWKRAEEARKAAGASKLLSLARLKADQDATEALAYATASLEMNDTQEARLFALELVSRAPIALYAPIDNDPAALRFSPDNKWLAVAGRRGMSLIASDGHIQTVTHNDISRRGEVLEPHFLDDSGSLIWRDQPGGPPQMYSLRNSSIVPFAIPAGRNLARRQVTERTADIDDAGRIVLSPFPEATKPLFVFPQSDEKVDTPRLSPNGNLLAAAANHVRLWRLNAPLDADPITWVAPKTPYAVAFNLPERWMVLALADRLALYSLSRPYPFTLHGEGPDPAENLYFTPDGRMLIAGFRNLYAWSLPGHGTSTGKLLSPEFTRGSDVHPAGRYILAGTVTSNGGAHLIPVADGSRKQLPGSPPGGNIVAVSFSPDGKLAAGVPAAFGPPSDQVIRIWDLEVNSVVYLQRSKGMYINALKMISDTNLVTGGADGDLLLWDLKSQNYRSLFRAKSAVASMSVANHILAASFEPASEPLLIDLKRGSSQTIRSHGNAIRSVALDKTGKVLVSGDTRGIVRVGSLDGNEPHILFGLPPAEVSSVAIHPHNHWIAGSVNNATVCLWEMPNGVPFHMLPHTALMVRLLSMTNVRVVEDSQTPEGYRVQYGSFPGWD